MSQAIHFFQFLEYSNLEKLGLKFNTPLKNSRQTYIATLKTPLSFYLPKSDICEIYQDDLNNNIGNYLIDIDDHIEFITFLENLDNLCIEEAIKYSHIWFNKELNAKILAKYYNPLYILSSDEEELYLPIQLENISDISDIQDYNNHANEIMSVKIIGIEFFKQTFRWVIQFESILSGLSESDVSDDDVDFNSFIENRKDNSNDNDSNCSYSDKYSSASHQSQQSINNQNQYDSISQNSEEQQEITSSRSCRSNSPIDTNSHISEEHREITSHRSHTPPAPDVLSDRNSEAHRETTSYRSRRSKASVPPSDRNSEAHQDTTSYRSRRSKAPAPPRDHEVESRKETTSHRSHRSKSPTPPRDLEVEDHKETTSHISHRSKAPTPPSDHEVESRKETTSHKSKEPTSPSNYNNEEQSNILVDQVETNVEPQNENIKLENEEVKSVQLLTDAVNQVKQATYEIRKAKNTININPQDALSNKKGHLIKNSKVFNRELINELANDDSHSTTLEITRTSNTQGLDNDTLVEIESIISDKRIQAKKFELNAERANRASKNLKGKAEAATKEVLLYEEKLRSISERR